MRRPFVSSSIQVRLLLLAIGIILPIMGFSIFVAVRSIEAERFTIERSLLASVRSLAADVEREVSNIKRTARLLGLTLEHRPQGPGTEFDALASEGKKLGLIVTLDDAPKTTADERPVPSTAPTSTAQSELVTVETTGTQPPSGSHRVTVKMPVDIGEKDQKVLSIVLPTNNFWQIVNDQQLPAGWLSGIVDLSGLIVARNRDADRFVGKPASRDFLSRATDLEGMFATTSLDGTPVVTAYARLPELGWIVSEAVPKTLLDTPRRQSILLLAVGAIGSLSITCMAALLAGRTIARPVLGLSRAARALGAGRMPPMPPEGLREADEVGEALIIAFDEINEREAALRSSEERYRRIFDLSPLGIMLATSGRAVVSVNPALCRLLGYDATELVGQNVAMFTHTGDRTTHAFADTNERGWRSVEKRFVNKGGVTVYVRLNVELYELPDGTLQFLTLVEDVTSRALAEHSRDKAEERLRHVEKIESLGRLTGGIAHDFNNLLLAISLNLEGLKGNLTEGSAEQLDEALHATELARSLTSQLLAFSRTQSLNAGSIGVNDALGAVPQPPTAHAATQYRRGLT